VVWSYLYKAVFPFNLAFIYPQIQTKADNLLCWLPLLAAIAITVVLWLYRRTWSRALLFAWGFFCVALVPVLGFTDVYFMRYSLVSDHYQHIALMGVAALAAAGFGAWRLHAPAQARLAMLAAAIVAAGVLACLTFRQSGLYKDEITLYTDTLQKNPSSWLLQNNLGLDFDRLNMPQEAIEHLERALQIKPDCAMAHNNLGNAWARMGRLEEAIEHFERALEIQPDYPEAQSNLGSVFLNSDRIEDAIEHFQQALRLKPDYPDARYNLGNALLKLNRLPEAIEQYERAVRIKPDYLEAQSNLGSALIMANRGQEAIPHCREALRLKPDYVEARFSLALAYAQISQPYDAIAEAAQSLQDANSQRRTEQAAAIENWLNSYRAGLREAPDRAGPKK
jgi:protein O-mannosyl-transferase